MTMARLQLYASLLAGHMKDIEFKPSSLHTNADELYRLPCTRERQRSVHAVDIFHTSQLKALPVTNTITNQETRKDVTLSKVYTYTMSGWPATGRKELTPSHACSCPREFMWTTPAPLKSTFLVIVDAHSKWPEVFLLHLSSDNSVSQNNICTLQIASAAGMRQHASFRKWRVYKIHVSKRNQTTSVQYQPVTMQTLKQGLETKREKWTLQTKPAKFLASYRNTPRQMKAQQHWCSGGLSAHSWTSWSQTDIMKCWTNKPRCSPAAGSAISEQDRKWWCETTEGEGNGPDGQYTHKRDTELTRFKWAQTMRRRHINQMHSTENRTTIEREQVQRASGKDTRVTVEGDGTVQRPQSWKKGTCWWRCCYSRSYIFKHTLRMCRNLQTIQNATRNEGTIHQTDWTETNKQTNKQKQNIWLFKFKSKMQNNYKF